MALFRLWMTAARDLTREARAVIQAAALIRAQALAAAPAALTLTETKMVAATTIS